MNQLPFGIRRDKEGEMSRFHSSDPRAMEVLTLTSTGIQARNLVQLYNETGPLPLLDTKGRFGKANEYLQAMYTLERRLETSGGEVDWEPDYMRRRRNLFTHLSQEVKSQRIYDVLPQMVNIVTGNNMPQEIKNLFINDISTLYLLLCKPPRFLVGTKGGDQWKNITFSSKESGGGGGNVNDILSVFLPNLHLIGRRELVVVPSNMMLQEDFEKVSLPLPVKSVEDSLEDAYFNQRYVVPPEGAGVKFRNARDLRSLTMIQTDQKLLVKVETERGETMLWLDTETAQSLSPDDYPHLTHRVTPVGAWNRIAAETYHDLVTAVEVSTTSPKSMSTEKAKEVEVTAQEIDDEDPQYIYIPRVVKKGMPVEPRLPYDGPPRPIKPHRVIGYKRKGEMTSKHEKALQAWSEETGLRYPNVPEGYTWVRPYVTPKGVEATFKDLPQFIKRRLETQIANTDNKAGL